MRRRIDLNVGWAESADEFDTVEVGDRMLPRVIRVVFSGAEGQPRLEMTIDSSTGVPRCTDLHITAGDVSREVRTKDLRAVTIEDWIEAITPLFMAEITERGADGSITAVVRVPDSDADYTAQARRTLRAAKRAARRRITPDLLRRVATVYAENPERPVEAIEVAFGVSERTAFRYASQARNAGYLESD